MRILLVDDEAPARALVRDYLAGMAGCEVVGEASDGFAALDAIARLDPDLVLLDIQMPGLDGFEVVEMLEREPAIVFATAYDEHALKAFEVGAVDYLLKPFDEARLARAIERALARGRPAGAPLTAAARQVRRPLERLLFREEGRVLVVPAAAVDYVEARGDYAAFRVGAATHPKQQSLAELEELLDPRRFLRIHRSYLVNVGRLVRLELYAKDSRVALLKDGTKLPVSRAGYARLRELASAMIPASDRP